MRIKVAVHGYGTIGKRVADAVKHQEDMKVIGVTKTKPDYEARLAIERGYELYAATPEKIEVFKNAGISVKGTIEDLIQEADIVVDCSPKKVGAENKAKYYEKAGIKAIFQGGEKKDVAEVSFNALANYEQAIERDYVRVVSCNTTGLVRLLYIINQNFGVNKVRATLIRRVVDPKDDKKGLVNNIMPDPITIPSHHGPDVQTVLDVDITTVAFKVPTTRMHVHSLNIELKQQAKPEDIIEALREEPRIMLVSYEDGFTSIAKIMEYAREIRTRSDLFENVIWKESIAIIDNELYLTQAIPQEAIVIPENIDAIRAMFNIASKEESMRLTNETLGIGKLYS
ncbi:type II glyceraldehyde-3-phosphate dehydrogenase [Candidatus Woesearchaeota archaeon]|nr:type II glyceraldehyde-3-phosphate dehydrogenase [Candidatus Woesearchaeota archaeon]RLE41057.1 MAG: type II glyceraldehyde-3-phosphate dehydrogenase [Candidatus Woesearchaeota archaeon]